MVGRNDRAIVDALEVMDNMMVQENEALQADQNQNQNVGADGFHGLGKFQKKNPPTFKGRHNHDGAQSLLQDIENIL